LAPELALGVVSGPERAEALDHLDRCPECRAHVEELAGTTDALVLLAPQAEPAAGFELRVMDRMRGTPRRTGRREVAAWILVAASILSLVAVITFRGDGARPAGERAVLRTAAGGVVGHALLYPSRPPHSAWIYVSMPGWTEWLDQRDIGDGYSLRIDLDDGSQQVVELPPFEPGSEGWGGTMGAEPSEIAGVAVVDADGRVLCSAPT
jgi:hypothetical protein